ncbi:MAG: glycine--tRNA ligase, partial [Chloroflexi bacterium]|nr:glycine--tRNA ligase [Chloroflexota bacterium]
DMVGLDAAILMHPDVWRASGHIESFTDPLVDCKTCHQRWREDQLSERKCPACGGELTDARNFNLMFKTFMGPVEEDASVVYLRPETAQGIFVNFNNVLNATRKKLPFGIAQIGKAFRNEITTGNFIFRTREFEMMEIEYFVKPGDDEEWHRKWVKDCLQWYTDLGINKERLRVREHEAKELAHYAKATHDIEYRFPWGWGEIQGIANRTDYDLKAHASASHESLAYFDDATSQNIVPYVIEPSAGVDRALMTFLVDAYTEEEAPTASGGTERRVLLKLHPALAPVKVAILPLSRNERLAPLAREVYDKVRRSTAINGMVQYDDAQSIGRRYRRQDEVGTPLCVTVDFDSIDDNAVTIRERDTMAQVRVPIAELTRELAGRLAV